MATRAAVPANARQDGAERHTWAVVAAVRLEDGTDEIRLPVARDVAELVDAPDRRDALAEALGVALLEGRLRAGRREGRGRRSGQ